MSYEKLFNECIDSSAIKEWRAQGKKVMGTICCHVPEEILHAAGIIPIRVRGTGCKDLSEAETWLSSFSCSFTRACLQNLMDGVLDLDGLVASDGCLMAGRIYDNWNFITRNDPNRDKLFFRQIAAPRLVTDITIGYYKDELTILKEELEKFTGNQITAEKLQASVDLYNETRALIRQLYELRKADNPVISGTDVLKIILSSMNMPKEEFNELLKEFLADAGNREPITEHPVRLMVIGSSLDDPEYMQTIEDQGGLIVTDALCFGTRYLWEPVELDQADPIGSLAKAYLSRPVCPRMLDIHDKIHEFIMNFAEDYRVDGIIYEKMQNCECWGGESLYLEDICSKADMPILTVEREEILSNAGQLGIRVQAFVEMIEE